MKLFSLLFAGLLPCLSSGGLIAFKDGEQFVNFSYVVPLYKHFGNQTKALTDAPMVIMDVQERKKQCLGESEKKKLPTDTVLFTVPHVDDTCSGEIGTWSTMDYLVDFCTQSNVVVFTFTYTFPGLLSNGHPGDYFKEMYSRHPWIRTCTVLITRLEDIKDLETLQLMAGKENLTATIRTDQNVALELFEEGIIQALFQWFIPIVYGWVVFRALIHLRVRAARKKLSAIPSLVLVCNVVLAVFFAYVEALGLNFLQDNISYSAATSLALTGFGSIGALNYLMAVLYHDVSNSMLTLKTNLLRNRGLYFFTSSLLVLFDLLISLLVSTSDFSNYFLFVVLLPGTCLVLQWVIVLFLSRQVKNLMRCLESCPVSTDSAIRTLLRSLSFWIKCVIFSSCLSSLALTSYIARMTVRSPQVYVACWFLFKLGRVGTAIAQVECCKLPQTGTGKVAASRIHRSTKNQSSVD